MEDTKHFMDKFKIWFMPTGWRPKMLNQKYPINLLIHLMTIKNTIQYYLESTVLVLVSIYNSFYIYDVFYK